MGVGVDLFRFGGRFVKGDGAETILGMLGDGLRVVPQVGFHANEQNGHVGAEVPYFWDPLRGVGWGRCGTERQH